VVAVEGPAGGEEPAEFFRGEGAAALVAEDLLRVDARLWRRQVADRVGGDQPLGAGGLEDAQQDRAARHHAAVAELALQLLLPTQHDRRGDLAELPPAEVGPQVAAEVAGGGLLALGAAPRGRGPELPPAVGPLVEGDPAAARVDPGVGGDAGEQVVLEVAGELAGVEGL
jgi:hypothetical protein